MEPNVKFIVKLYFKARVESTEFAEFEAVQPPALIEGLVAVQISPNHTKFYPIQDIDWFESTREEQKVQPIALVTTP